MSSRGQVVIPKELRRGIEEGTPFTVSRRKDAFILKKMKTPSWEEIWKEFDRIFEENRKIVKRTGLKQRDVVKIIHRIRKEDERLKRS